MDSLQEAYIEEAQDLFESLEQALLEMERTPGKPELIEEVFRVMHTLKGNSSMFGYEKITELVHDLETIYDLVREGKMKISGEILDQTFHTLDHLRKSIDDPSLEDADNRRTQEGLVAKINLLLTGTELQGEGNDVNEEVVSAKGLNTYHISFLPDEDIMANGTNLLYLLDELHSLGNCVALPHFFNMPGLDDFKSEKCYASWDIFLVTDTDKSNIQDVFVFVEDDAKLSIDLLADTDLLSDGKFVDKISKGRFDDETLDIDGLKQYVVSLIEIKSNEEFSLPNPEGKAVKEKVVSSVRVASDKLDGLMNIVSEMVTTQASLSLHAENHYNLKLETISENVENLTRQLRDIAFGMTLIPINNLFSRFQRMIRDLSHEMGKEVRLITSGGETELDKTIIEKLADPLMHILRNSLDHGIESVDQRKVKGKSKEGKIELKAFYSGAYVNIQISDDGKGIDPEIIKKKAIENGLVSTDAVMSEKEIMDLIFTPGFSTAEKVTDVSGRGVGMDVVRRNIADLRGEVLVDSQLGEGTTITLKLPLTLSIIDGLLVKVHNTAFIIPLSVIDKCHEVNYSELLNSFNELLVLDEVQIPFLNLRLEFQDMEDPPERAQVIVVDNGDRQVALSVDYIIGEYQAVLKPLPKYYKEQDFISGATILGDGTIALVLDTNKIINDVINQFKEELI